MALGLLRPAGDTHPEVRPGSFVEQMALVQGLQGESRPGPGAPGSAHVPGPLSRPGPSRQDTGGAERPPQRVLRDLPAAETLPRR